MSKGDWPRPWSITYDEFDANWGKVFNKKGARGMKMRDVAKNVLSESPSAPVMATKSKDKKEYPHIRFTDKQLPELKGLEFNQGVAINIHGIITGIEKQEYNNPGETVWTVKIHKAAIEQMGMPADKDAAKGLLQGDKK